MLIRALVAAGLLWLGAIVVAPLAIASSQGAISLGAACVYAAGSRVCHQRPARCFRIQDRPMPVCARCTGLYAGAAIAGPLGLLLAVPWSRRRARLTLTAAAVPTVLSWGLEYAGIAHPSNAARAILALPLGFVAAWLIVGVLAGDRMPRSNGT